MFHLRSKHTHTKHQSSGLGCFHSITSTKTGKKKFLVMKKEREKIRAEVKTELTKAVLEAVKILLLRLTVG